MTKYLSIAILLTSFLAGNAYGEGEVYYCAETASNGFYFDETLKKYATTKFSTNKFSTNKFKIKFDSTAKTVEIKGHPMGLTVDGTYPCTLPFSIKPELLSCTYDFYHFNFDNGRFVLAMINGHVFGDDDTISVSYGKCDKF